MAGLPWIELHTNLPRHPKSIMLAAALNEPRAWSYMAQVWLWCAENCVSGRIVGTAAEQVLECAADWRGDPGLFARAARETGFIRSIDGGLEVVGWGERAAPHLAKKEKDAERLRQKRQQLRGSYGPTEDVATTSKDVAATSQRRSGDIATTSRVTGTRTRTGLEAKRPPRKQRAAPNPRHAPMIPRIEAAFLEERRAAYGFTSRDARPLQALLALGTDDEIEAAWRRALRHVGFPSVSSLGELVAHWNHFVGTGPPKPAPRRTGPAAAADKDWDQGEVTTEETEHGTEVRL